MPQDNPRNDGHSRSESARAERMRGDKAFAMAMNGPFGEMAARSVTVGLRLQKEMFGVLSEISQDWLSRATSEAELAFTLPNKLTAARSMPDAFSAYQQWLTEWIGRCDEDSRRFASDGRKLIDAGVRCFSDAAPTAMG
jgi:hypothetical protein